MSSYFMDNLERIIETRPTSWVPAETGRYDRAVDLMSGNLPSYIAFTPEVVQPLLETGLETLKKQGSWPTQAAFEENIVNRALNSASPTLKRSALNYLTQKAQILDQELPYGYEEWEAAHGNSGNGHQSSGQITLPGLRLLRR